MQMLTRLDEASALDGVSDRVQTVVTSTVRPQRLRDLLHGTWLGHPLHPVLVELPVGAFFSAAVLDLLPGGHKAATRMITLGVASASAAIVAGWTDWSEMTPDRRRVGLVHAVANTAGVAFYVASLVRRRRRGSGRALSYAGLAVAGLGAYLGGHLAYAQSAGTNQAAPELVRLPKEWTKVGSLASLPDGKPAVRTVGDVAVLFYRRGDRVGALIERCGHETGPLGDGEITGSGEEACVVCPWHGSTFRLTDGAVVHGPAASDQPRLRVRVAGGMVEVCAP